MTARRRKDPSSRSRDPERTRTALLDAAQGEFADHGLAGARVDAIADRAGVNKQLIAYHFGGKQGLYDAVAARREAYVASFDTPDVPLPELSRRYVQAFADNPELERIFLREALEGDPASVEHDPAFSDLVAMQRRQRDGEIAEELDPAFVLLLLQAMTLCGAVFPGEAMRLTGLDPRDRDFRDRLAEQMERIVSRLACLGGTLEIPQKDAGISRRGVREGTSSGDGGGGSPRPQARNSSSQSSATSR